MNVFLAAFGLIVGLNLLVFLVALYHGHRANVEARGDALTPDTEDGYGTETSAIGAEWEARYAASEQGEAEVRAETMP